MDSLLEPLSQEQVMKAAFRYHTALVTYAYAHLRDYHLAEDVVQETLLFMMQRWQDFQLGTSVYAWARQITHFKILEAQRARQKSATPLENDVLDAMVEKTLDENLDEEWAAQEQVRISVLQNCLLQLNKRSVSLLKGFYNDSLSYKELSDSQGLSIETIRKSLFRCRKVLQACVAQHMGKAESFQ
jgi:RNA polymerase sigma-70 factor (ECF subfamily)